MGWHYCSNFGAGTVRAPVTVANVIYEENSTSVSASLLFSYLHCNIGNTKVGCDTDSQKQVKDCWLDPAIKKEQMKLLQQVLPQSETIAQHAQGNSIPVCVHHLFQLVIENKFRVPVKRRNSSGCIILLDTAVRTAQASVPKEFIQPKTAKHDHLAYQF